MRKKIKQTLSFLLTFVMLCGLLPMTAMAAPGDVTASKTAEYNTETGEVTITMTVKGEPVTQTTKSKADVVLVVDNSGSMASGVGTPCNTPSSEFEKPWWDFLGWVKECPTCHARYWNGPIFGYVPEVCEGETGGAPRIDTAKKVGKTFAGSILSKENDNRMAVIGFAHGEKGWDANPIKVRQDLTKDVTRIDSALDSMDANGGTDYTSALQAAYDMLDSRAEKDRPGYVVFISDGAPGLSGESISDSDWNGSEQATAIKNAGYKLYTIGISLDEAADDYLESLASDLDHYKNVDDANYAEELKKILEEWAEDINTVNAGTEAELVDSVSEGFTLVRDQDVPGLTFDYEKNEVTWNVGDITKEEKQISFKVIPKEDTSGNGIPTNASATLTYKDPNGTIQNKDVATATVDIPAPPVQNVTLTYDANGGEGTVSESAEYPINTEVTVAEQGNLVRDNAVFLGWSETKTDLITSAEGEANARILNGTFKITEDTTLYAVWAQDGNGNGDPDYREDKYNITYQWAFPEDAKWDETDPEPTVPVGETDVISGTEHTVDVTFVKDEREVTDANGNIYTFRGWTAQGADIVDGKVTVRNADVTITGTWEQTGAGGSYIEPKIAAYFVEHYFIPKGSTEPVKVDTEIKYDEIGNTVMAEPLTYDGYTYDADYSGIVNSGTVTLPIAGPDGNPTNILTLKLYYTQDTYTVTYEWTGAENLDATLPEMLSGIAKGETYEIDSTYQQGTTVTGTDGKTYIFSGWTWNGVPVSGTQTMQAENVVLKGAWSQQETQPIVVSVYRNSNTETPIFSKQVDELAKGETFNLSKLEGILADAGITGEEGVDYEFDGWYNDGGWNNYLQGNPDNTLGESITINGWTNIKCMVTDYVPIHVYAVVDGDQANAEEIYSDKALMGENLLDYLNANVPEKAANWDRDGYDRDLWYNWDWFGHKFNDETKVNGWTKVYVTYTSQEQVAQMVIYRNGNMEEPYQTVSLNDKLDGVKKNDVIQLNGKEQTISLNGKTVALEDYYTPDKFANGYVFDGWFNDGAWNQYKDGETVEGLNEITVNGWTNIIVMVWDEFPVYYHIDGEMVHTDTITAKDLDSYEFYQPDPREDYTFDGWYEQKASIQKKTDISLKQKMAVSSL